MERAILSREGEEGIGSCAIPCLTDTPINASLAVYANEDDVIDTEGLRDPLMTGTVETLIPTCCGMSSITGEVEQPSEITD